MLCFGQLDSTLSVFFFDVVHVFFPALLAVFCINFAFYYFTLFLFFSLSLILFSKPGDRRDRLKRFVASAELEGGETLEHVQQVANKFMQFENQLSRYRTADSMQSVQTESFFSEGSEELKEWRKKIAILSLQKARDRLAQQREESISSDVNEFSREQKHSIVQSVRDWTNVASQVGSDRPLSACSISPCGTLMALGSWDESITLWDVPRCHPSSRFSQPLRGLCSH